MLVEIAASVSSGSGGEYCTAIFDGTLKSGGAGRGMERRSSVGRLSDSSERDSLSTFGREVVLNPSASSSSNGSSEDSEKLSP